MASFQIIKPYTMSRDEVREATEELARELKQRYGLSYRWQGDRATFRRNGLDGRLSIENGSIDVTIKLGFLASAFEKPLKDAMTRYLDEHVT